ncbi:MULTISPECIES: HpcH/HpaI aldolase family protein [Acetobacteraceae]|uniref:HpcH/HpaI aldolase family protein n=1 Tax=Acetobacteraceae TaxID=433 RepID=UPI001E54AC02|nr:MULTISPECIES: HpcH/HpaI aldolase/citrate lyase family protein [Acetobacteraceae]MCG0996339.1 HpcH/HpaI aldolase/citrate lyase family protein [Acetobacter indonesiensis]WEQ57783.1 HpcH/HpaI aldolase/citrate lyase family protein [Novacetimonas hansenii]
MKNGPRADQVKADSGMPKNLFKERLRAGELQIGLWLAMADPYAASIAGYAGFDWLVVDGEHGPNDLRSILNQLLALEASASSVVVRPPMSESWFIKQLLDIGCQTLLVPMVETAEQAQALVRAVRYPPRGIRGMGAAIARSSRFNTIPDYVAHADDSICLLVQVESRLGIDNLEAIAAVDGVDGVFIGPADLAANLGLPGRIDTPEVQHVVEDAIQKIRAADKPAGILTFSEPLNQRYIQLGASFVAVGADVTEFSLSLANLRNLYNADSNGASVEAGY